MNGRVAWIHVAPVKGLAVVARDEVDVELAGARGDRAFHLVDGDGRLVNMKRLGKLALARAAWDQAERRLELVFPDGTRVEGEVALGEPIETSFYGRPVVGRRVLGAWSETLSEWAETELRLVHVEPGEGVDRGPYGAVTLLSTAALDELAREAGTAALDARRFRMTFGVDGVPAHEEDSWVERHVRVGEALVVVRRLIGRCAVTKTNPDTGERDVDTLGAIEAYRGDVPTAEPLPFGVAASVVEPGRVRLGDAVAPEYA